MAEDKSTTAVLEPEAEGAEGGQAGPLGGSDAPDSDSSQPQNQGGGPSLRQIRVGKDFAFVANGQQVVLFDAPQKVGPKSHVVLPGYHLNIFDQVVLRAGQARYSAVNFHRAYGDTEPLSFDLPDFNQLLKEGDPVWVELISGSVPAASGLLFPYLAYTKQGPAQTGDQENAEEDEETEEAGQSSAKTSGRGQRSSAAPPAGLGALAVAAGGEAISGILGASGQQSEAGGGTKKLPLKDRLKQALQSGDRQALKECIEEAKLNRDVSALQEISQLARSAYDRVLFDDALGHLGVSDFSPRRVSGGPSGGKTAGGGGVARSTTTIKTSGTVEAEGSLEQTAPVSTATSVQIQPGSAETSLETGAEETVNTRTTVIGRGGTVERQVSGKVEDEAEQEINVEDKVQARAEATPGRTTSTKTVSAQAKGRVEQEVKDTGSSQSGISGEAEAQISDTADPAAARISNERIRSGGTPPKAAVGEIQAAAPVGGGVKARVSASVSDTLQRRVTPENQSGTGPGSLSAGQAAGIREKVDIAASLPKTLTATPAAGVEITAESSIPQGPQELSRKLTDKSSELESEKVEGVLPEEEQQALARIPEEAKRLAATFKSRAAFAGRKEPGITLGSDKSGLLALEQRLTDENQTAAGKKTAQGQRSVEPVQGVAENQQPEKNSGRESAKLYKVAKERSAVGVGQASRVVGQGAQALQPGIPSRAGTGLRSLERPEKPAEIFSDEQPAGAQPKETETASKKTEAQEQEELQDLQQQQAAEQQNRVAQALRQAKIDDESLKKVVKEANVALDSFLMEGVELVWAGAIETFGLTVLLGAIIGDFLWMFKGSIIKGVLKPLLRTEFLKKKAEQIAKQIKISVKVKLNIVAMNAIVAAAVMLLLFILLVFLWVGCNYPPVVTKLSYKFSVVGLAGGASICESLDNITNNFSFGGGSSGGGGASDSWGSPDGLLSTNQWTGQINQAAAKYSVDACILRVVVQKESAGQADVIGCDCAANGKPELCPAGARSKYYSGYPFNWDQCSYGIGLTQWTIYPRSSSQNWNRWENSGTPSRNLFGDQYYYLNDFLNPQTSLDLTARAFKNYLAQSGGDVAGVFRAYMGGGAPQSWVDQRMALYNMCKTSSGQ